MGIAVRIFRSIACFLLAGVVSSASYAGLVGGTLQKWHPITIDFAGPFASEEDNNPNPFLDYRLIVELTSPGGSTTYVPGFFAGDGEGNSRGNVWRVRFSADEEGTWSYQAQLHQGSEVAVNLDWQSGEKVAINQSTGQFIVSSAPSSAPEFLRHGRLEYVGNHYLKFRDGPYWIKGGTDSPENLLGYSGIDGTYDQGGIYSNFLHDYANHQTDWRSGDPLFYHSATGADSRGLIGALNYLSDQGVNSVYFLPMNLGGDGQETYPFVGASNNRYDKTHYDISKLYQWNVVLNHAQEKGIALNVVLSETEPENERWLDNGELGVERKLFFRELVARFGYLLAVKWNLGEENDFPRVELDKHADYLQAIDWSGKPIAVHTHINQFYRYGEIVGDPRYEATSIQYDAEFAGDFVEQWRSRSASTGHPWVVDMDENTNGLSSFNVDTRRKQILYDVLFSGGNIEWYFGYHPLPMGGDVDAGDFRLREAMWQQMRYARELMQSELPFWEMQPSDQLVQGDSDNFGGAEVFTLAGQSYAVYLPSTNGLETLDLSGVVGSFTQRWFNPRTGETYPLKSIQANGVKVNLGQPPIEMGDDWVVLITRQNSQIETPPAAVANNDAPSFTNLPSPSVMVGDQLNLTLSAIDSDGTFPSVTVGKMPAGMRVEGPGNGQLLLSWQVPITADPNSVVEVVAIDAMDGTLRTQQSFTIRVNTSNPTGSSDNANTEGESPTGNDSNSSVAGGSVPEFQDIAQQSVVAGQLLSFRVQADDSDGIPPALMIREAPDNSRFEDNGDGTRTFYWQTQPNDAGSRNLVFVAQDHSYPELTDIMEVIINIVAP